MFAMLPSLHSPIILGTELTFRLVKPFPFSFLIQFTHSLKAFVFTFVSEFIQQLSVEYGFFAKGHEGLFPCVIDDSLV